MRKIMKMYRNKLLRLFHKVSVYIVPTDKKMIMFMSFLGRGYNDSPKYLYEFMKNNSNYKDYKYIWVVPRKIDLPYPDIKVTYFSLKYFYYLARSKYWFFNAKMPTYIRKKKNQVYLQMWHGTPLKKLGYDIEAKPGTTFYASQLTFEQMCKTYEIDSKKYNYMISPNTFSTQKFQSAFHVQKEIIIETGYPRNDCLVNYSKSIIQNLKSKYNIPSNKKVILYAPTWRDNSINNKGKFVFNLEVDFTKWRKVLGDSYIVLFKPHYLIANHFQIDKTLEEFVYSIGANEDINNLYLISDLLITDYSSVFFDYSILNKPIYFFMYDLNEYKDQLRGFYLDINELPGEIVQNEDDLLRLIVNNDYDFGKLQKFNKEFNSFHDGHSCQKLLNKIFEVE